VVVELLLVRHALPEMILEAEGPADPGLTDVGRAQAARLADYLADQRIDRVVTSPLRRAVESIQPTVERLGLTALVHDDLAESDRHMRTYVPMEDLRRDPQLAAIVERANVGIPHETPEEFRTRVVSALESIVIGNPGERVAVMSHGGVINAYLAHILGLPRDIFFEPRYVSISRVLASRRGHRNIETLNETHFLSSVRSS
jgi:probable phosphoglycerate mutase